MNRRTAIATETLLLVRHRPGLSQRRVAAIIGIQFRPCQRFECGEKEIYRIIPEVHCSYRAITGRKWHITGTSSCRFFQKGMKRNSH